MVVRTGAVTRPKGASKVGPPAGTRVSWKLTQPIFDLCEQGARHGFRNLGTVGNTGHLQRHGDHTPWSPKGAGWIWAKDTDMPTPALRKWLVDMCKSPDYDTSWIDFFNVDGRQYDSRGVVLCSSDDWHFHVSVAKGHQNTHVTLFDDFVAHVTGTPRTILGSDGDELPSMDDLVSKLVPAIADAVWRESVSSPSLDKGAKHGVHEGVITSIDVSRRLRRMEAAVAAIADKVGV